MKKALKRIVAVALVIIMVSAYIPSAFAAGELKVSVGSGVLVNGGKVVLPVSIENVPENLIAAAELKIVYDTSSLTLTQIAEYYEDIDENSDEEGLFTSGSLAVNPASGAVSWAYARGLKAGTSGILFWVVFTTVEGVVNGDYAVELKVGNSTTMFADKDQKDIPQESVVVENGIISVTGGINPTDLNPVISSQPKSDSYTFGQSVAPLTVEASVNAPEDAVLTYQWYSNTSESNEGGTLIANATGKECTPVLNDFGTAYYYCVVTNTYQGKDYTVASDVAAIEYKPAAIGNMELSQSVFTYTGHDITPQATINGLTKDTDYTLSGDTSATIVGAYKITATGKGNYTGTSSADWSIEPAELNVSGSQSMTIYNNGKSYVIGGDVLTVATVDGTEASVTYAVKEGEDVVQLNTNNSLTALKEGSAIVTATATAANHNDKTVDIPVTVKNKESAEGSMTFDAKKSTATYTGSPMALHEFVNEATCSLTDGGTIRYQLIVGENASAVELTATVTNAGTYTVKAIYESDTHYGEKTLTFTIERAEIVVNAAWNYVSPFTYDNTPKSVALQPTTVPDGVTVTYGGTCQATNAGKYTASATLAPEYPDNYTVSGAVDDLEWVIDQAEINVDDVAWNYASPFTYDGNEKTVGLTGVPDTVEVKYSGTIGASDADTYTASAILSAKDSNYVVKNAEYSLTWVIEPAKVTVPTAAENLIFDGTEKIGVAETDKYSVENGKATDAGSYTATVTLRNANNYEWATAFEGKVRWSIAQAAGQTLTENVDVLYSDTTARTIDADSILAKLSKAGEVTITEVEETDENGILTVALQEGVVSYALTDGLEGSDENKTATVKVTFTSTNYERSTLTVTVMVVNKNDVSAQIQFENGTGTYNGQEQSHETATFNGSYDNISYTYTGDRVNVGKFSVTATYEDATQRGTKTVYFDITPKTLYASNATVQTKEYDGTTAATVTAVQFAGLVADESLTSDDYQVSGASFDDANAGVNKTVTYTVSLKNTSMAKNYTLSSSNAFTSGTIRKKEVTVTLNSIDDQTFSGGALRPTVTVNAVGLVYGESLIEGTDYIVSYDSNTNVGTANVTVSPKDSSNYTFKTVNGSFQINKAAALIFSDMELSYVYAESGSKSVALPAVPENAGVVSYQVTTVTGEAINGYQIADRQLNFELVAEDSTAVGTTTTAVVEITMGNYATSSVRVVITRTDKAQITASADPVVVTYTGNALTNADLTGTASVEGKWVWVTDTTTLINANELGYEATVKFVPNDSVHYAEKEVTISVIVLKANPTGEPGYTKITESGKTLADAELNVGTIQPDGNIAWELEETTEVESGVAYKWIFTPDDTGNYNTLEGSIVLYEKTYVPPYISSKPSTGSETTPEEPAGNFVDVAAGAWYADAVEMVVREGLFTGVSANRFDPEGEMTRAMLVTVLWRLDGEPAAKRASSFQDVVKGSWYAEAVAWANENGIVNGYNDTTFGTNDFITREQMAAILYRYANYAGVGTSARADLSGFTDLADLDAYAEAPMAWAVAEGLINGLSANRLAPNGNATRAQVATILMRFVENIRK